MINTYSVTHDPVVATHCLVIKHPPQILLISINRTSRYTKSLLYDGTPFATRPFILSIDETVAIYAKRMQITKYFMLKVLTYFVTILEIVSVFKVLLD